MARATRRRAPAPSFSSRLTRLGRSMQHAGFDGLLISNPPDIRYLTGFSGEASVMVITSRERVLISDFRFQEELQPLRGRMDVVIRKGSMLDAQASIVKKLRTRRLAVQAEYLSAAQRSDLGNAVGASCLRDSVGLVAGLRLKKDPSEIAAISRAAKIQQEALLAVRPTIAPGQTEREIAARLEYEMLRRGAEGTSFQTIVAAKANGSKPHYRAGPEKTARGRTLLIDWGARYDGYCADMTRVFALGSWPRVLRDVYQIVLEAHEAAIAAAKPGLTAAQLDAVARTIITNAGYAKEFGHGLGHGIGLDIHEAPRLFSSTTTPLEPGMVVTIEPGIYLPGVGGVRIEDDILITPRGARNLCSLPKDLKWATLHG